jgi:hypothetical protein
MHKPQITQGGYGKWHADELAESGVLVKGVKFSLGGLAVMDTKAHLGPTALNQIVRSRTNVDSLIIDLDAEAITDGNGNLSGVANVYAGQNLPVCAHFAADVMNDDGVTVQVAGRVVMGFKRDATRYLQVQEPGIDLSPENPAAIKYKLRYLPEITFDVGAL